MEDIVLLGHHTGAQDVLFYMQNGQYAQRVTHVIFQGGLRNPYAQRFSLLLRCPPPYYTALPNNQPPGIHKIPRVREIPDCLFIPTSPFPTPTFGPWHTYVWLGPIGLAQRVMVMSLE